MLKQSDKEYAGIMGYPAFRKAATEFALTKDSPVVQNEMVCRYICRMSECL